MKTIYKAPSTFNGQVSSYCPGCGHGIIQRIIGECIDELGINRSAIGILGVGCSSTSWKQMSIDMISAPHGRPAAVASGVKRCAPNKIVYTYQGDGDAGSIGIAETIYAAVRGENITAIVVNNTVYAMTGGQMAPTTLEGQVTITSPEGRNTQKTGYPLHLPELLAQIPGVRYAERVSIYDTNHIKAAKKAIKKALQNQVGGLGYSLVEILSPCPNLWKKTPIACMNHIKDTVEKEFPLGVFKDDCGGGC